MVREVEGDGLPFFDLSFGMLELFGQLGGIGAENGLHLNVLDKLGVIAGLDGQVDRLLFGSAPEHGFIALVYVSLGDEDRAFVRHLVTA